MMDQFLIIKPWVTERGTELQKIGKYIFKVADFATKPEVKKALKEIYKVDVVSVNIVNKPAKKKRMGSLKGHQKGYKKAIVTLRNGQKIDIQ